MPDKKVRDWIAHLAFFGPGRLRSRICYPIPNREHESVTVNEQESVTDNEQEGVTGKSTVRCNRQEYRKV